MNTVDVVGFCLFLIIKMCFVGGFAVQGGKTFCASFCASLIAGSRRAFLCVDCVRLLLEF